MAETVTLTIPREALTVVAPPPEFVHQRNVAAVVGLPSAQYLALCRRGAWRGFESRWGRYLSRADCPSDRHL